MTPSVRTARSAARILRTSSRARTPSHMAGAAARILLVSIRERKRAAITPDTTAFSATVESQVNFQPFPQKLWHLYSLGETQGCWFPEFIVESVESRWSVAIFVLEFTFGIPCSLLTLPLPFSCYKLLACTSISSLATSQEWVSRSTPSTNGMPHICCPRNSSLVLN